MKLWRAEVHGHVVEARLGDYGGETILLDGRIVSSHRLAGVVGSRPHQFTLTDENGRERLVEARWHDRWGFGMGVRILLTIDGRPRGELVPARPDEGQECCLNCGYSLIGLPVVNGELRCPECGRHTPAALAGRSEEG